MNRNPDRFLTFRCRQCGWTRTLSASLLGKRGRCKRCGHVQRIEGLPADLSAYELKVEPEPTPVEPTPAPADSVSQPAKPLRNRPKPSAWRLALRALAGESSQVQGMACCLLALSVADLFMTYTLLRSGPLFFESNPVAQWFFARWNMAGMALFKFGVMAGVIALGEIIERQRPGWGRFVLGVGCAGAAYAVFTGLRLYLHHA